MNFVFNFFIIRTMTLYCGAHSFLFSHSRFSHFSFLFLMHHSERSVCHATFPSENQFTLDVHLSLSLFLLYETSQKKKKNDFFCHRPVRLRRRFFLLSFVYCIFVFNWNTNFRLSWHRRKKQFPETQSCCVHNLSHDFWGEIKLRKKKKRKNTKQIQDNRTGDRFSIV